MAKKADAVSRVPRGTKVLMKAFFTAADEIPEPQRDAVVKAAFAGIRDELKFIREKAKAVKAKTRASTATAPKQATAAKKAAKKGTAKKSAASKPVAKKIRAKAAEGTPTPALTDVETAEA